MYIIGAGGLAREVYQYLKDMDIQVTAFIDTTGFGDMVYKDTPILRSFTEANLLHRPFIIAVGSPKTRAYLWEEAIHYRLTPSKPLVHPSAYVSGSVSLGEGCFIAPHSVMTCHITMHPNSFLNISCTVGHDTVIGSHCMINPGVNLSGNVDISERCLIGTNSSVREKISIGPNTVIGMGSVVVSHVPPNVVAKGVPARW